MRAIAANAQAFQHEQRPVYQVQYWDTTVTPLYNDVASRGVRMDVYEPSAAGFTHPTVIRASSTANLDTDWNNATGNQLITNGRAPNVVGYWAGGAPGYHGVTTARRLAYRFAGTVRSTTARGWFSGDTSMTVRLAAAGSGYLRIVHVVSGTPTERLSVHLSEETFLATGPSWTAAFSLATGDTLRIYYAQDEEVWGGFVVKAILGNPTTARAMRDEYRYAPIVGAGLIDDGSPPAAEELRLLTSVETRAQIGETRGATLQVPLLTPGNNDENGWEWVRDGDDTGYLVLKQSGLADIDVRRHRLIRIRAGFRAFPTETDTLWPIFTGWVDDFDVNLDSSAVATIRCLGLEQRLADQLVKNYPDRISYMSFDYRKLRGTTEPVYEVVAYDNWPLEWAIRDMLIRAGMDESRLAMPKRVPQSDGSEAVVEMVY